MCNNVNFFYFIFEKQLYFIKTCLKTCKKIIFKVLHLYLKAPTKFFYYYTFQKSTISLLNKARNAKKTFNKNPL